MKSTRVAVLAAAGMLLTSVSVYSLTPPGGAPRGAGTSAPDVPAVVAEQRPEPSLVADDPGRFVSGAVLTVEGRLGSPRLLRASSGETFVMLDVRPSDAAKAATAATQVPVNLSLVIDRSGSMRGARLRNAISAATLAVDRLHEGDVVSVVTFDTQVQVVVPPTAVDSSARPSIESRIRGITLGGDTCISCGIETAMVQLGQTHGKVDRMIVLSDGDANHGVHDVPGFRAMAARARDRGTSITTIGVDVDYNEKILSAIAEESNGRHYFVENADSLGRVFEAEAESLTGAIASNAEAVIDLAPGVELERVFDRSFRRVDRRVVVPLGTFAKDDVKTVLLKVRLTSRAQARVPVASVELGYRDHVSGGDGHCGGTLAAQIVDASPTPLELDPVVAGRVQRSETSATLKEANLLFEQGRGAEARRRLDARARDLKSVEVAAQNAAPPARKRAVEQDFEAQVAAVNLANTNFSRAPAPPPADPSSPFATPPAAAAAPQATREGKSAVRLNQQRAGELGF